MGQLPRQPEHGRCPVEPHPPLLPHRPHRRTIASRSPGLTGADTLMERKSDKQDYIRKVLHAYRLMPGTTGTVRRNDTLLAATFYDRGVPLIVVENALVLAAARRIFRSPDAPTLQP